MSTSTEGWPPRPTLRSSHERDAGHHAPGQVTASEDEAAFRMLVVDPAAQGHGLGALLVRTCLDRARAAGKCRMVLVTGTRITAAQRLYRRLGFTRLPERGRSPVRGIDLLVYSREL